MNNHLFDIPETLAKNSDALTSFSFVGFAPCFGFASAGDFIPFPVAGDLALLPVLFYNTRLEISNFKRSVVNEQIYRNKTVKK